jgi:hypothetical protein
VGHLADNLIRERNYIHSAYSTAGGGDGGQEKKSSIYILPMDSRADLHLVETFSEAVGSL